MKNFILFGLMAFGLCLALAVAGVWFYGGSYGINVLLRHGGTYWIPVKTDDAALSPSMRLALEKSPPATPGHVRWRWIDLGFEAGELPVMVNGTEVDRILLARIDPARYRFALYNDSSGSRSLDQWMAALDAVLVINGSYYGHEGTPATPFLSAGILLGPKAYDARAGAFVAADGFAEIRNLDSGDWRQAFLGADDAMVSFPLLFDRSRPVPATADSRWLANRSFVAKDWRGRIVLGTTADAFFSLARLSVFLQQAPLGLRVALNLDGGPVACQGIQIDGFDRRVYGKWELQAQGNDAWLLAWPYGTIAMPIVLAVLPR